ncbi:MAG: LamG-like jellyroll fold domain-containing protein, partial [Myxococcota bacterium]|nr:LamG-like jellyroll fold domain-containing protein [Myxococcota bacterium]
SDEPPAYRLSVNNEGTVAFQVYDDQKSAGGIIHTTGYAFEVGQWVHVAVTWDGEAESLQTAYASGESTGFSIVINGVNEADLVGTSLQGASGISNFVKLRDTPRPLWLGLQPTANHISDVQLDKVLIFRNHMSTEAIKVLGMELCNSYLVNAVDNLLVQQMLDHGPYAAWEMGEFLTAEGEIRDEVGARPGAPYTQTKNFAYEAGAVCE